MNITGYEPDRWDKRKKQYTRDIWLSIYETEAAIDAGEYVENEVYSEEEEAVKRAQELAADDYVGLYSEIAEWRWHKFPPCDCGECIGCNSDDSGEW